MIGASLIDEGLRDLEVGLESVSALLVLTGAPRLRELGFAVPDTPNFPEDRLYELLAQQYGNSAHSKYNALLRTLVSFERGHGRHIVDADRTRIFIRDLAMRSRAEGRVYITGGASLVLLGRREMTGAVDLIRDRKAELHLNVEVVSPAAFIPEVPGWQERSVFIAREAKLDFYHYDFYAHCLAKIERGYDQDLVDVRNMLELVDKTRLLELFEQIEPDLIRYPAIDAPDFRRAVETTIAGA